jgi:hypothetical protein
MLKKTLYEIFRGKIVKQAGVTKNNGLHTVEGSAPSEAEKEAAHGVRARDVVAPATPGVMAHHGKEKNVENLWMVVRTWTNWNLIREPLRMNWP